MLEEMGNSEIVFSLMVECPFKKRLHGCPLEKYSNLNLREKFTASKEMSDEMKANISRFHSLRCRARENIFKKAMHNGSNNNHDS